MLSIVATPIGNLEDITLRAIRILKEADFILTEDTRRTAQLLSKFEISGKTLIPFYDEIESGKSAEALAHLLSGAHIALVTDAGTPLVSDPGFKLVRTALEHGIKVETIPGPSSPIAALTVSGLPPDKFLFIGFPPEKQGHQMELFNSLKATTELVSMTVIMFASPYKFSKNMTNLMEVFGDFEIVVVRELTKIHEEVWRGKISEATFHFSSPRGEFVVLFHK